MFTITPIDRNLQYELLVIDTTLEDCVNNPVLVRFADNAGIMANALAKLHRDYYHMKYRVLVRVSANIASTKVRLETFWSDNG